MIDPNDMIAFATVESPDGEDQTEFDGSYLMRSQPLPLAPGSTLGLMCQTRDCGTTSTLELDDADGATLLDALPAGWAWEYVGADEFLRCPKHSSRT